MSVAPPSTVPPNVVRDVTGFARALMAAHRTRQMYSADHPTTRGATERLRQAAAALANYPELHIGVSPNGLFASGDLLPFDRRMAEAAAVLHDRDIISLRFAAPPTEGQIADLLQLMGFDSDRVRQKGGPGRLWSEFGHKSIELVQIDYEAILAAGADPGPIPTAKTEASPAAHPTSEERASAPARDDVWTSLVHSLAGKGAGFSRDTRDRLRQIAQSSDEIASMVRSAVEGEDEPDSAKRRAAQAATVLTAFDRLVGEVEATDQEQVMQAIRNIAKAATQLDPILVMEAVEESAESGLGAATVRGMGDAFDDGAIANLLAASMARHGRATGRMAAALNTLAPDPERRGRVLRLAARTPVEKASAEVTDVASAWSTLEQILTGPSDKLYTSSDYAFQLREMELRSHRLRLDAPEQLDAWIGSVSADSVRNLSVTLMLDLFLMEDSPAAISETALDLARVAEDLLETGDFAEVDRVILALCAADPSADAHRANASRVALDQLAGSPALAATTAALGDFDEAQAAWFQNTCRLLGPAVIPALLAPLDAADRGPRRDRLVAAIVGLGDAAVGPLAGLLTSDNREHSRTAIQLLGRIGGAAALAALQSLIGGSDARKMREAIIALVRSEDPAAVRPVAAALQHADPRIRLVAIDGVVASQARRSAALLASTLRDLQPFGPNFPVAMQILAAMRRSGDDQAACAVATAMRAFSWRHWRQAMKVKRTAASVLASMNCPAATAALADAARQGDFFLKRYARVLSRAGA